jgi:hypothetical protein
MRKVIAKVNTQEVGGYEEMIRTSREANRIDESRNAVADHGVEIDPIEDIAIEAEWFGCEGVRLAKVVGARLMTGRKPNGAIWRAIRFTLVQEGSEAQASLMVFMPELARAGYKSTNEVVGNTYHFFFSKIEGKDYPLVSAYFTNELGEQQSDLLVPNDNISEYKGAK